MNRRDWVKTWAVGPTLGMAGGMAAPALEAEVFRLKLRHTWTTTMSSSDYRDELQIRLTSGGITGHGEGAPIVRYNETAEQGKQMVESLRPMLTTADLRQFAKIMAQISAKIEGQYAAKSAIDIALMDWNCQKLGMPLYRYLGLDAKDTPVTTFSIGIDTPEITKQKVRKPRHIRF